MFTPTKAACGLTEVANVLRWRDSFHQEPDVETKPTHDSRLTTHLLHAAGELQLRYPKDQLAGRSSVHNLNVSRQTAERGSVFTGPTPPHPLKSESVGETRLGLGVFGLWSVLGGSERLRVNGRVCCDSPLQYKELQRRNPKPPRVQDGKPFIY